jgi:exosortase A
MTAHPWRAPLVALGAVTALILALFARDAGGMARIWATSASYQHVLLLPPLLGWLVWQQRGALAAIRPMPWAPGLVLAALGALAWLFGAAGSLAVLRHGGLVLMLQGAVVALLGRQVARLLAFPLLFALFLVPAGSEAEPWLQAATAKMAVALLRLAGVPTTLDGIFITIPNGYFRVAQACSGAGFLIAMAAYAALVCHLCFKSWTRRALFTAFALGICFLANGVRAFAIISVAWATDVTSAVVVDHVVYGWVFFALVILLVMLAARRFFDRPADAPLGRAGPARESRLPLPLVAGLVATIVMSPLLWLHVTDRPGAPVPPLAAPLVPGWTAIPTRDAAPWRPHYAGADRMRVQRYRRIDGAEVDLAIAVFADQREGRELIGFGQGAGVPDGVRGWTWAAALPPLAGGRAEQLTGPRKRVRLVVSWYVVGGHLYATPAGVKAATLRARLLGGDPRAAAILVSAERLPGRDTNGVLAAFARALGPPERSAVPKPRASL